MESACQVSFPLTDYLITLWRQKTTQKSQKLTLLTYFTIIERRVREKWTKSNPTLRVVWKSFPWEVLYEQYWHKRIKLLTVSCR